MWFDLGVFPQGRCECGTDLSAGRDLGVVDRYQQYRRHSKEKSQIDEVLDQAHSLYTNPCYQSCQ